MAKQTKNKLTKKSKSSSNWEIVDDLPKAQIGTITLDEFRPKFTNSNEKIQQEIKKQEEIKKLPPSGIGKNSKDFLKYIPPSVYNEGLALKFGTNAISPVKIFNLPEVRDEDIEKPSNFQIDGTTYNTSLRGDRDAQLINQGFPQKYNTFIKNPDGSYKIKNYDRQAVLDMYRNKEKGLNLYGEDPFNKKIDFYGNVTKHNDKLFDIIFGSPFEKEQKYYDDYKGILLRDDIPLPNSDKKTIYHKDKNAYGIMSKFTARDYPDQKNPFITINDRIDYDIPFSDNFALATMQRMGDPLFPQNRFQIRDTIYYNPKTQKVIKPKKEKGGKIKTTLYGQWEYPGEITRIPSGDITMQGVNYPVYGVDNLGNSQIMYPGMNYTYPGSSVTEYPMMQTGGRPPLKILDPREFKRREQAYNDSLNLYNKFKDAKNNYKNLVISKGFNPAYIEEWATNGYVDTGVHPTIGAVRYGILQNSGGGYEKDSRGIRKMFDFYPTASGTDLKVYKDTELGKAIRERYPIYEKPVQPVVYEPRPIQTPIQLDREEGLLESNPINLGDINPIPFEPGSYFTRKRKPQEADRGKMEYFDKKTGRSIGLYDDGGELPEAGSGYKVVRSSERKGKTHKVIGPDGTVKFFGDSKLGQHPKDPARKKAFYARHKKNLAGNPYFRAFARKTWEEGGMLPDLIEMAAGGQFLTVGGEYHRIYKNADGDIMVNHPKEDKGKWDTINLTKESDANTIAEGVASVRKWHRENPYAFGGNIILEKYQEGGMSFADKVQLGLDVGQFIPGPIGTGAYIASLPFTTYDVGKDLYEGNYKQAGLDALGYIPALKAFKYGAKGNKMLDTTSKLAKQLKKVNTITNVTNTANDINKKANGGSVWEIVD